MPYIPPDQEARLRAQQQALTDAYVATKAGEVLAVPEKPRYRRGRGVTIFKPADSTQGSKAK